METNESKKISKGEKFILSVVLSVVTAALCLGFSYFGAPAMSVMLLCIVYLSLGYGFNLIASLLYAGGGALLCYAGILKDFSMLYDALYFIAISWLTTAAFKKGSPYRRIVTGLTIATAFSVFMKGVFPALMAGKPAFSYMQALLEDLTVESGFPPSMAPSAQLFLPYSILIGMLIAGIVTLLTYRISNSLSKVLSDNELKLKPMAPMRLWCLSKNFRIGVIVFGIAAIFILFSDIKNADIILMTMLVIAGVPLCVQGVCFIQYAIRTGCMMMFSSWLIWPMLILFFPSSLYLLGVLGLVDQFSGIRSKFPGGMPPPPPPDDRA